MSQKLYQKSFEVIKSLWQNCFKYFQIYILGQMSPQKSETRYSQRFLNYINCQND